LPKTIEKFNEISDATKESIHLSMPSGSMKNDSLKFLDNDMNTKQARAIMDYEPISQNELAVHRNEVKKLA
jgi:hypothetical protein